MARKNQANDDIDKAITNRVNTYLLRFFRATTTVCITATIALVGLLYSFGGYLYNHSEATKAAINTFIEVKENENRL